MGGKADNKTQATTTIATTTDTSTTMGDIGLTGNDAVALANVIAQAGVQNAQLTAQTSTGLYQQIGDAYNKLVAGAGNFLVNQSTENKEQITHSLDFVQQLSRDVLATTAAVKGVEPKFENIGGIDQQKIVLIFVAGLAVLTILNMTRK